ncbi:hypothetical protein PAI11_06380 [Patulibacter medicamentivorans]|uniref:Uncharacterized protein n=1 Tax=Patulibacter medicamentivorans TaxID=1097667 RepID=H0E1H6_9ACTN|nr:hypothetical protein PAI11_06380 [Patulibacter medicamentivorans]
MPGHHPALLRGEVGDHSIGCAAITGVPSDRHLTPALRAT